MSCDHAYIWSQTTASTKLSLGIYFQCNSTMYLEAKHISSRGSIYLLVLHHYVGTTLAIFAFYMKTACYLRLLHAYNGLLIPYGT